MKFPTTEAPEGYLHGWYSQYQADLAGTALYRTDTGGVLISAVSTRHNAYNFEDLCYVGLVHHYMQGGFICKISDGRFQTY